jgi:quercetin dioxygenase-like cupin family protein
MISQKARAAVTSAALVALTAVSAAQKPQFTRTELQRGDVAGVANREVVQVIADIPGGVAAGRHTHPGEEFGYVLEGTVLVEIDGRPAATMKAGQAFVIPAGAVHNATNKQTASAKVLATYIIEKGKPIATPVK